jgi:lysophospholipase L1-like esterase
MLKFLTLSLLVCSLWAKAPYQTFYDYKLQEFAAMKQSDLVFLGDSLTMRHNWSEFRASNMGIDGDTTAGVLSRMHLASQAKTIVLMIGVNDILNQIPLVRIQSNYTKILKKFSRDQKIYILSLLPVIDTAQTRKINQDIKTINKWLKIQTKEYGFEYTNLYPEFLDTNKKGLKEELTNDGIHLTPKAYRLWSALLRERLK